MSEPTVLCWLRRDLRLSDHAALHVACATGARVAVCFVFDTTILDALQDRDDARVTFIHDSLTALDGDLRTRGSRLVVLHGDPITEIPKIAQRLGATEVYASEDYEPAAIERDRRVAEQVTLHLFKDQVIRAKWEILSGSGEPFKVFTPYSKAWLNHVTPGDFEAQAADLTALMGLDDLPADAQLQPLESYGFATSATRLAAGERDAREQLASFAAKMDRYGEERDFVDSRGVSRMSVHLRFGTISVRECFRLAQSSSSEGARKWLMELIWREFYMMILSQFPHVVSHPFKQELEQMDWPGLKEHYEAWEKGQTGYPIVDAAMRCLNATGWMHNRARMIVAMFLTKDLLVDYRLGEAHFARKLLDFDLAQNNGGWQWSASTGVDAQPYFRVFNPYLQSRKFDPTGDFIREWCPEMAGFSNDRIHAPHEADMFEMAEAGCRIGSDYPNPIVDHAVQRDRAIALFKLS